MSDLLPPSEPPEPVKRTRADAMRRADEAWRVRVAGGTWEDAARVAGYANGPNALRAVRDIFGQLPKVERDDLRGVWRARGEVMWRQVQRDMAEGKPGAVVAGVRLLQAAAVLDGLNAPTEHVLYSPSEAELEAWVVSLTGVQPLTEYDPLGDSDL